MTTTIPDVDTLHELDWQPACQIPLCVADHPAATHLLTILPCECTYLICRNCIDYLNRIKAEDGFVPRECARCHQQPSVEWFRIEPLP